MKASEFIFESHDSPFDLEFDYQFAPTELHAEAYDRQGRPIEIHFVPYDIRSGIVDVEFTRDDSHDMTGGGDGGRVFATVLEAFREYLKGYRPKILVFSGKGSSRQSYYNRMIARYAAPLGYKQFDVNKLSPATKQRLELSLGGSNLFVLRRSTEPVNQSSDMQEAIE